MAAVTATNVQIVNIRSESKDKLQTVLLIFNLTGTYAQADNAIISGIPTLIANARRSGKVPSIKGAMLAQPARKASNPDLYMALKTVAVSGSDVTCEVTEGATAKTIDYSTELANGAMPDQETPFGIFVCFEEASI